MNRIHVAAIGLVVLALLSGFRFLLDIIATPTPDAASSISTFDTRFAALKSAVPGETVLGYFTDSDMQDVAVQAEYHVAQYALAPIIVLNRSDQKLVVGMLHKPGNPPPNFELVRDFGNGVKLFRNQTVRP